MNQLIAITEQAGQQLCGRKMNRTSRIQPGYLNLMVAVIQRTINDLKLLSKDKWSKLDNSQRNEIKRDQESVMAFFLSERFEIWCYAFGIDHKLLVAAMKDKYDILKSLKTGGKRKIA